MPLEDCVASCTMRLLARYDRVLMFLYNRESVYEMDYAGVELVVSLPHHRVSF